MAICKDDTHKCTNCVLAQVSGKGAPSRGSECCHVFCHGSGVPGSRPLRMAWWQFVVRHLAVRIMMDEPNEVVQYKAFMNLQCSEWTWKATMHFRGNDEMDEKECTWKATYFQDKVNVKDNGTCEAVKYSQNDAVDNNGVCKAATYLQDEKNVNSDGMYEAWMNSWVRNCSMLKAYSTSNSCLVKNVDVAEYNKVVVYDLVQKYDMVTKNDIMTKYDMVKLVHKKFNDVVSLAVMNRDGMKVLKKSFEDMAALMMNPVVLLAFGGFSHLTVVTVFSGSCAWWSLQKARFFKLQS